MSEPIIEPTPSATPEPIQVLDVQTEPQPDTSQDLMPNDTPLTPEPYSAEDFGEPLKPYEVDNLKYALSDGGDGSAFMNKLTGNNGILNEDLIAEAKALGVSQRQIDGYTAHHVAEATRLFADAGIPFAEGRVMMQRVQNEFSARELEIFTRETNENPTASLQRLKVYFDAN